MNLPTIAVAGLGRIGWSEHCMQLKKHPRFKLVAVMDPLKDRCEEAENALGVQAYQTLDALLQHPNLDVIVLASPTHLHHKQSLNIIHAGKHLLLEKPMATCYSEAKAIVEAAEKKNLILEVYQPHRYTEERILTEQLLKRQDLGEPYHLVMNWHNYVRRNDWQALKKYGGGMALNYGAHSLDFMLSLTGHDITQLFGHTDRIASMGDAEDMVSIRYVTNRNLIGEININQGSLAKPVRTQLYFTKAYAEFREGKYHLTKLANNLAPKELNQDLASEGRNYPEDKMNTIEEEFTIDHIQIKDKPNVYDNFADAIEHKSPLTVPPRFTLEVMKVIEKLKT